MRGIAFLAQCIVVQNALGISHTTFHKKYCNKDKKFSGKSGDHFINCFPCILKLKEFFNVDIESGFRDTKSYIEYLDEIETEKELNKEFKRGRKKNEVKKKYNSSLTQFEKLKKYFKDCYNSSESYFKFNDEFNPHEREKKIWSLCGVKNQRMFSNFLLEIEQLNEEQKEIIMDKLEKFAQRIKPEVFIIKELEEGEISSGEENETRTENEKSTMNKVYEENESDNDEYQGLFS